MATPSQVDNLIDDATLGRIDADEAVTRIQQHAVRMIQDGRQILAHCRAARAGLDETHVALVDLRRLRPSVRGRRTDLEGVAA